MFLVSGKCIVTSSQISSVTVSEISSQYTIKWSLSAFANSLWILLVFCVLSSYSLEVFTGVYGAERASFAQSVQAAGSDEVSYTEYRPNKKPQSGHQINAMPTHKVRVTDNTKVQSGC
ncbi:hypothetical protein N7540_009281 [Penicillium herquei]|nr:hypothetical protein N7540_009281 [Penicillium herquei]